ncbi:MAG: hypothetical protein FJY07_08285 [Bacteroidetes bacterium]|nr:hypothetical protein [Bacteroidota bacterium]
MKWNLALSLSFLVICIISCDEIAKEVAGDDLVGAYQGSETMIMYLSKFNIGLEDQTESGINTFNIIKNDEGKIKIVFSDASIVLNAVQLAANGTVFNIPRQKINLQGQQTDILGLNECMIGEMKCDGFYNSDTKKLIFSFEGVIPTVEYGVEYEVPFSLSYEVKKL